MSVNTCGHIQSQTNQVCRSLLDLEINFLCSGLSTDRKQQVLDIIGLRSSSNIPYNKLHSGFLVLVLNLGYFYEK